MKVPTLYRVFLFGAGVVILVTVILFVVQKQLVRHRYQTDEAMHSSPGTEVEFESGEMALNRKRVQLERLNSYHTAEGNFVEVPLERAKETYLEMHTTKEAKQ